MEDLHSFWKNQDPKGSAGDPPSPRKTPLPYSESYSLSATSQLVLILSGGIASAVAVGVRTCMVSNQCDSSTTCVKAQGPICGFTNRVSVSSDATYASSSNATSAELALLLRGPCSPGDRFQKSKLTSAVECVPYFPFPSAINTEIMDPLGPTPHDRACGKWIEAAGNSLFVSEVTHRSMVDHSSWLSALEGAEDRVTESSRTASSGMAKFRAECERTVTTGTWAVRTASAVAYQHLADEVEKVNDREGVLRASGFLASHTCDATVTIGSYLSTDGNFYVDIYDGHQFSPGVLSEALRLVGEPSVMQAEAESASTIVNSLASAYSTPALNSSEIVEVLKGATGESNVVYTSTTHYTNILDSLMVYYDTKGLDKTLSYMRGIAAYCVYSLRANVEPLGGLVQSELTRIRSLKPRATAIGRLATDDDELEVSNDTVKNASTITLSQLASSTGNASTDCLNFMRQIYPDHVDAARFQATIPDPLYSRIQNMVMGVRVGLAAAVQESPLQEVLLNPSLVANDVATAGVRIAGAPRGSWAGIARALPEAIIDGSTGVFVMALMQAREQFKDRVVGLVFNNANSCDHPPFSTSTTLNAYMIPSLKCTVLFLGMAKRPWLDSQYDDESLAARGVMVISHELAHLTLNTVYVSPAYETLLRRYVVSTYSEAIADVGAALGTLRAGLVSRDRLLTHWCQVWCARVPLGWTESQSASHPENNGRCDYLHDTVVEHVSA